MADPTPSRGGAAGLEQIADEIASLWRAVGELRTPTGTQQYNAVPALEAAVAALEGVVADLAGQQAQLTAQQEQLTVLVSDLDQRITDFINDNIDAIVTAKVSEKLASNDITIGAAGGVVRMPSIFTTDVVATQRPRVAVWADDQGTIGHT